MSYPRVRIQSIFNILIRIKELTKFGSDLIRFTNRKQFTIYTSDYEVDKLLFDGECIVFKILIEEGFYKTLKYVSFATPGPVMLK